MNPIFWYASFPEKQDEKMDSELMFFPRNNNISFWSFNASEGFLTDIILKIFLNRRILSVPSCYRHFSWIYPSWDEWHFFWANQPLQITMCERVWSLCRYGHTCLVLIKRFYVLTKTRFEINLFFSLILCRFFYSALNIRKCKKN